MEASFRPLTHRNLQRLFDEVGSLYRPIQSERLPAHFNDVLKRLIPADFYGVSIIIRPEHDQDSVSRQTTLTPAPSNWDSLAEAFAKHYAHYPLRAIRESGNLHRVIALSDVASRAEVERLDLYHHFYRALRVQDEMNVNFGNLNHRVCLAVLRRRRGFSAQDRAILAAIRPHMERAYRYACAFKSVGVAANAYRQPAHRPTSSLCPLEDLDAAPCALSVLGLSAREAEVLYWVAAGKSSPVISAILCIGHDTVRSHLKRIFAKLGVENRLSAALRALQVLRTEKLRPNNSTRSVTGPASGSE
jgi:DNA-binding CsgD family transcriptional regulator